MMKISAVSLVLAGILLLSGCGSFSHSRGPSHQAPAKPTMPVAPPAKGKAGKVVTVAQKLLGTPYKYGGTTPRGFDCSGFTSYVFKKAGVMLPRTAAAQFKKSLRIKRAKLAVGDLLFFRIDRKKVSHVGIYTGGNRFIHAPSSGKSVTYGNLKNPYWRKHWIGAGRVL